MIGMLAHKEKTSREPIAIFEAWLNPISCLS